MARVWDETQFKGHELLVFLSLADHANDQGVCWPSQETLARKARCSERTVKRIIARLKAEGFLEVVQRWLPNHQPTSNNYRLIFAEKRPGDNLTPAHVTVGNACVTPGDKNRRPGDKQLHTGGQKHGVAGDTAMAHKPSGNHNIESSIEPPLAAPPSPPKKSLYFSDVQELLRKQREAEIDREFIESFDAILKSGRNEIPTPEADWIPFE